MKSIILARRCVCLVAKVVGPSSARKFLPVHLHLLINIGSHLRRPEDLFLHAGESVEREGISELAHSRGLFSFDVLDRENVRMLACEGHKILEWLWTEVQLDGKVPNVEQFVFTSVTVDSKRAQQAFVGELSDRPIGTVDFIRELLHESGRELAVPWSCNDKGRYEDHQN